MRAFKALERGFGLMSQVNLPVDSRSKCLENLAERVGFEPTIPVKVFPLSRRIVSTAHAPLRNAAISCQ